ncbi:hypothetical protein N7486_001561 [Penicillium sp. IBT 16267x]|nr:hypothetical protein N7486_001561 [Penicillium sp. IBT 16267x]
MAGFTSKEIPMSQNANAPYMRTQEYASTPRYPSESSANGTLSFLNERAEDANDTVIVDNKVLRPATHKFAEGDFIPPGFFNHAQLDGFTRRFSYSQWTYEMRREAQPILPFLYLGPSSCLRPREYLRNQGFTLLLGIRNTLSAQARLVSGDKAAAEVGILADTIDVLDNQELISAFPRAIRRINDHLAGLDMPASKGNSMDRSAESTTKKKVLVFCETGNERSAGVVIAYIMAMLNQDFMSATHLIQQHRFCVSVEEPLKRVLHAFDSILAAKRDVERAKRNAVQMVASTLAPPPVPPVVLARKRSFRDCLFENAAMDDDHMDMDADDFLQDRKPVAPFQDRAA